MNDVRMLSLWLCFGLVTSVAPAMELADLDRSIRKEPDYQTATPRYCLLALGEEAKTQVWLVVDGDRLYLDRNANGDLTDPGESVLSKSGTLFSVAEIVEADGATIHRQFVLKLYDDDRFRCSIKLARGCRQTVGYGSASYTKPRMAVCPAEAPIIHLNGPMTFARYGPISFLPREPAGHSLRRTWLRVFIGSPGLGEATFAGYNCQALRCETGYRDVTAQVEFASRTAGAPSITLRDHLKIRG